MTKYGAKKTELDGYLFDSLKEANRYWELKMWQMSGEISDLEVQPKFPCVVNGVLVCNYFADFRYFKKDTQEVIIEDVKGMKTDVYRLKKKLVEAIHNVKITEV